MLISCALALVLALPARADEASTPASPSAEAPTQPGELEPSAGEEGTPKSEGADVGPSCEAEVRGLSKAALRDLGPPLLACAVPMRAERTDFAASVSVSLQVARSGEVVERVVRLTESDNPELRTCLEAAVDAVRFPPLCVKMSMFRTYQLGD